MRPSLEDTIALAAKAHVGQVDKGGAPYILHPLHVKLADLLDNMDRSRIPNPTERDQQRWAKYTDTWHRIHRAFRSAW